MAKLKAAQLDPGKDAGSWVTYRGLRFRILRWSGAEVQGHLSQLKREHRTDLQDPNSKLFSETMVELSKQTLSGCVIADWTDIEDEDGNDLPFSREMAATIVNDESFESLMVFLLNQSRHDAAYMHDLDEADLGN